MANINPTRAEVPRSQVTSPSITLQWSLANGDVGYGDIDVTGFAQYVEYPDRSVQVSGTFGAGGTVVIEGSNDGVNWSTLTDQLGNALSITSADIAPIMEVTRYIRPRVSAGDGSTNIAVTILLRRALF